MSLNGDILTKDVHINMVHNDGTPRSGTLTFTNTRIGDGAQTVPDDDIVATLDGTGQATVTLIANLNNPGVSPNGSYWRVLEQLDQGYSIIRYIQVDANMVGSTIEYDAILSATPNATALTYVTQAQLIQAVNDAISAIGTGVTSVNGHTGVVVLSATDITTGVFASAQIPSATGSVKGGIVLTGDLGGTATSPTVPGLASKATDSLVMHLAGAETATGVKTFGNIVASMPDKVTSALTMKQLNTVTSTSDKNIKETYYLTNLVSWENEKGCYRGRRVDQEVVHKFHGRGNDSTGNSNTDITQWTVDGGSSNDVVRARVTATGKFYATNLVSWGAVDFGFLTWNYDPAICPGAGTLLSSPGAGTVRVIKVPIPYDMTITNIHLNLGTAGASLTSGQCHLGLFNSSKTLLAEATTGRLITTAAGSETALDSLWAGSTGLLVHPLASTQAVSAGFVYVGLFYNGTTAPSFFALTSTKTGLANGMLSAANSMHASADTGRTTSFPSPLGTLSATAVGYWAALS